MGGNDFLGGAADVNQHEAQGQLFKAGAGRLKPSGTGGITINISDAGGLANQDYTLIDWNGVSSTTGVDLTDFVLGAGSPEGTLSIDANKLVYSSHGVPEPSTAAAMFAVGAVFVVGTRWRNRRRRAGRTAPRFSSDS